MVPKMMFGVIDVRDCARAHIIAMTSPKAPGNMSFSIKQITNYCKGFLALFSSQ